MPTMIFSAPNKFWRPLCTNSVRPETSVIGEQCLACVEPIVVPPPPECGGTATWLATLVVGVGYQWVLQTDECTGTGTPQEPSDAVAPGLTAVTDCCTGETISITGGEGP